jgi:hypothetical protein
MEAAPTTPATTPAEKDDGPSEYGLAPSGFDALVNEGAIRIKPGA